MAGEIQESEQTKASLEAMEKLEAEERGDNVDVDVDEEQVEEKEEDPNNQMGGTAVVGGQDGATKTAMKNSILPEETNVKADPFIDRGENSEKEKSDDTKNAFIDADDDKDDPFDAFIDAGGKKDSDFLE
jgi:hypothetical protein